MISFETRLLRLSSPPYKGRSLHVLILSLHVPWIWDLSLFLLLVKPGSYGDSSKVYMTLSIMYLISFGLTCCSTKKCDLCGSMCFWCELWNFFYWVLFTLQLKYLTWNSTWVLAHTWEANAWEIMALVCSVKWEKDKSSHMELFIKLSSNIIFQLWKIFRAMPPRFMVRPTSLRLAEL